MEVARALEGGDAAIDGELVAIGKDGISHFQLLQNALRNEAKLQFRRGARARARGWRS